MNKIYYNEMSEDMKAAVEKLNDCYFLAEMGSWKECESTQRGALARFNEKFGTNYKYFHSNFYGKNEKMFLM